MRERHGTMRNGNCGNCITIIGKFVGDYLNLLPANRQC